MKVKFDSKSGENDQYIKVRIELYECKVNTNFQGKKVCFLRKNTK